MFTSEFVDGGRGLVFRGSGAATGREIIEHKLKLLEDAERLRSVEYAVVDLERVESIDIRVDEVRTIADLDRRFARLIPRGAMAVGAAQDGVYGVSRMWSVLVEGTGWRVAVFRSRAEAETWLKNPET